MIKSKRFNLIMVLSVVLLLISLLLSFVNITGAWFTDSSGTNKTVNAYIKTSEANLNVYQENSTGTQTRIEKSLSTISLAYDSSNKTNNKIAVSDLPLDYTQLEYLESTGTQYIDTAVKPSTTLEFDLTMQLNKATGDQKFFGSYNSGVFLGTLDGKWRYGNSCSINDVTATTDITRIELKNGVWYFNSTPGSTQSPNANDWTISLFAVNYKGNPKYQLNAIKVYSLKIWQDHVQVRNFIPAKNSSGVCGMYDTVEGKFYTNAGTGTFVGGEEVCDNNLKLLLKNEDFGASFGVRYKVNFYAITATGKQLLTSSIAGMTTPTSSTNGFVYNSTDGYYYYQNNSGANVVFEPKTISASTSKYLMKSFTIAESSSANLFGGNSIYMEISVESINI